MSIVSEKVHRLDPPSVSGVCDFFGSPGRADGGLADSPEAEVRGHAINLHYSAARGLSVMVSPSSSDTVQGSV